ncbi:MAG: F0F1 ATP synthase subunit B' [Rhodospirillaceae bacterium]|nr:F0F1 ATP synthase subunit B' [Rhodospirillaceae bacterium]|tara:strand:+ start:25 stop:630 length:606 start_codon:yes stop_codon:yes gene_type:complete
MRAILGACRGIVGQTAAVIVALGGASDVLAAGDGGGAKLPQLDIATFPTQIFWLVVSFLVLYILVSRIALPRISEVLEERQDRIADDLDKAETLKKEAEQVRGEYEKALAEARNQAHAAMREAQDEAAKNATETEAEAREKVANMLKDAEERIEATRSEAMSNVRNVARDVAGDAVAKLIRIQVLGEEIDRVVDATMEGRN